MKSVSKNYVDSYSQSRQKLISRFGSVVSAVGAFAVYAAVGAPNTAVAADQNSQAGADATQVQEIVVTARKHEERLQDVPLAITALSAVALERAGIESLRDVTFQTPGLVFTSNGAQANEKPVIRGQTDIGGGPSNVSVFLDGIYIQNSSAFDLGVVQLDRIEVIKGPVSALYGRSAYSGAINYVTATPADYYKGDLEVTFGDYGREQVKADISGPIIPGILKGGISGSYDHFDGDFHDSVTDQNANGYDRKDVLANLDLTPGDHFEIRPVAYYGADFFNDNATKTAPSNCGAAPLATGFNYSRSFCGQYNASNFEGPYIAAPGNLGTTGNNRFVLSSNLQVKADYDWGTVSSLTGFNNIRQTQFTEFDNTRYGIPAATYYLPPGAQPYTFPANPALVGALPTGQTVLVEDHFGYQNRERDYSEELRYRSPQDQPFRWSIGGYYAKTFVVSDLRVSVPTNNVPAGQYIISAFATQPGQILSNSQTLTQQQDLIYAGFVSADWDIFDNLTFSTELRETSTKSAFQESYGAANPFVVGYSIGAPSKFNPYGGVEKHTFYSLTSRNTLTYKFNPDLMVYASAANGEKVGGFNAATSAAALLNPTFNPETNWTYEAGVKSSWLDHRLQLNVDVYHIDAKNYQISAPADINVVGGFITKNFGSLSTNGIEASAVVVPLPGITVTPGIAYTDPQFNSDAYDFSAQDYAVCASYAPCSSRLTKVGAANAVSLKGLQPPNESNFTVNLAVEANYPVYEDWNWFGRVDYRYESKVFYTYPDDAGSYGPRNNVNLRTGVENDTWKLTFWVENLTNDQTPVSMNDSAGTGGIASDYHSGYYTVAVLPDKRTIGGTLKYSFNTRHQEAAATTAYTPPPVVAPAPAVAHSYQVFFDFNKSDLTPEAVKVVDQAAANAAPAKVTRIDVTGHTDTVGSDAYNMRLSRRRAESVAAELQARGIPSSEIAIFAKGKKDLLVPTADGVREPQNRRVQIVYEGGPTS